MKKNNSQQNKKYLELAYYELLEDTELTALSGGFSWGVSNRKGWTPEPEKRRQPSRGVSKSSYPGEEW